MPTSLITLLGNTVTVVQFPAHSGALMSVDWNFSTAVAMSNSIFTGGAQAQIWPGADALSGTATYPPLTQKQADPIIAALMQCQGMANAFQLGDPLKTSPRGVIQGTPVVDGSVAVVAGGQILYTTGWTALKSGLLLAGDFLQVGFRLHRVLDTVSSDVNGKAAINIWPSLREVPVGNSPIITSNPLGLFRLASNKGTFSSGVDGLTHISYQFTEYR
jgi:hypothetical protein